MTQASPTPKGVHKKLLWSLAAGAVAAAVVALLMATGVTTPLENATYDWRIRQSPPDLEPEPPIVLLLIDQQSLDFYARESGRSWPWRRDIYGAAITALQQHGARAVVFDVLFTEPSREFPEDDQALADATGSHRVLHAFDGQLELSANLRFQERDAAFAARQALAVDDVSGIEWAEVNQLVLPLPSLTQAAAAVGSIRYQPDADGKARSVELLIERDGKLLPSLALIAARDPASGRPIVIDEHRRLTVDRRTVPLDGRGRMHVRYLGPERTFRSFSFQALVNDFLREMQGEPPEFDWAAINGATVLIGTNFTDLKRTPYARPMPGVEVHANVLANLQGGIAVRPMPRWLAPLLAIVTALVVAIAIVAWGRPVAATLVATGAALAYLLVASQVFASRGLWLPIAAPALALVLSLVTGSLASFILEGRERLFLRRAFEHYLSPKVIAALVADPTLLRLGGTRRELTVFFSDLANFTSISEKMSPTELVQMLNIYLSEMTDRILERGGTVDKYIGDAIMAFWGAPLDDRDHARAGCLAALDNQRQLRALGPRLEAFGAGRVTVRIGLATGPAVVGNMGSEKTFNYTAMGDTVNLAARLEGLNKRYGTSVMASGEVRAQAGAGFLWRELDLVAVKGKTVAIAIHELVATDAEADDTDRVFVEIYERALGLYRRREFGDASRAFRQALAMRAEDLASQVMLLECAQFERSPPPESWQGEHVMLTK